MTTNERSVVEVEGAGRAAIGRGDLRPFRSQAAKAAGTERGPGAGRTATT
jgi:hypothetical protein